MINPAGHLSNPRIRDEIAKRVSDEARSGWLIEHRQTPEQRAATLRAVFFNDQPRWRSGFAAMLLLSMGVATFGLSENSAAVIIGAMIIAPLGQPIIALGAALAMAWSREAARLVAIIMVGAIAVVGGAFLLSLLLPHGVVNTETLARTAPDLRDLGIATLAGAAGAFAYARDELSGVLPGVAIAVALVPPLAVVGTMLEQGHLPLAAGAAILFLTNLVGIAAAAAVVMLLTRFAPLPKLRRSPAAVGMLAAAVLAVVAIGTPLVRNYLRQVKAANQARAVHLSVQREAQAAGARLQSVRISGSQVIISVEAASAVEQRRLESELRAILGPEATVTLRITR